VHSRITFYVYAKIGQVSGGRPPPRPPSPPLNLPLHRQFRVIAAGRGNHVDLPRDTISTNHVCVFKSVCIIVQIREIRPRPFCSPQSLRSCSDFLLLGNIM